jgi:D-xylose transport system substrate-binding protein
VSSAKKAGAIAAGLSAALLIAACSSSSSSTPSPAATSGSASGSSSSTPSISISQLNNTFSAMSQLTSITASGKGKVAVILPDTTSSTRYVEFDKPLLTQAFTAAGLPSSDLIMQNALGSDATQTSDAQADITNGASVLVLDPLDSGTGAHIEQIAKAAGVQVIDYDRLTLGGSRSYYVSFDNVKVGQVMAHATLFAEGSQDVLGTYFSSGKYKLVSTPPGTWTADVALSEFQQQYTAHSNINAALIPNDENGAPIIHYLQGQGVKPKTFPTTGQDATLTGLQNILSGYQCGTVYKPIYLEAQAAAALALYVRDGKTPPASLVNGQTKDTQANVEVPSVLLNPEWVTPANMNATIIADKFVPAAQLCAGSFAADCKAAGITG